MIYVQLAEAGREDAEWVKWEVGGVQSQRTERGYIHASPVTLVADEGKNCCPWFLNLHVDSNRNSSYNWRLTACLARQGVLLLRVMHAEGRYLYMLSAWSLGHSFKLVLSNMYWLGVAC